MLAPPRAQHILLGQISVSVNAHGRKFQFTGERAAVERFNVNQLVPKFVRPGVDFAVGQSVEHERIVRIRTMADAMSCLVTVAVTGGEGLEDRARD